MKAGVAGQGPHIILKLYKRSCIPCLTTAKALSALWLSRQRLFIGLQWSDHHPKRLMIQTKHVAKHHVSMSSQNAPCPSSAAFPALVGPDHDRPPLNSSTTQVMLLGWGGCQLDGWLHCWCSFAAARPKLGAYCSVYGLLWPYCLSPPRLRLSSVQNLQATLGRCVRHVWCSDIQYRLRQADPLQRGGVRPPYLRLILSCARQLPLLYRGTWTICASSPSMRNKVNGCQRRAKMNAVVFETNNTEDAAWWSATPTEGGIDQDSLENSGYTCNTNKANRNYKPPQRPPAHAPIPPQPTYPSATCSTSARSPAECASGAPAGAPSA